MQETPLCRTDECVRRDPDRCEDEDGAEEDGEVEIGVCDEDHTAQTSIGAGPFPDDRTDEGKVQRDACSREEIGKRARHAQVAEDLTSGRPEGLEERNLLQVGGAKADE